MRVYKVEFEGYEMQFHGAATEEQIVKWGFCNAITLSGLDINDGSITLKTTGFPGGWDKFPTVKFTAHDYKSYTCNCCKQQVPGDGGYDICHLCGWENEPGETNYPDEDGGPNHMTLNEGIANYKKGGYYKAACTDCGQIKDCTYECFLRAEAAWKLVLEAENAAE
jgi:hypothetical protein